MFQDIGEQVVEGQDNSADDDDDGLVPNTFVLCPQFDRRCDSDGKPKGTVTTYTSPNWDGRGGNWDTGKSIYKKSV
jgi:hypothetical protein